MLSNLQIVNKFIKLTTALGKLKWQVAAPLANGSTTVAGGLFQIVSREERDGSY